MFHSNPSLNQIHHRSNNINDENAPLGILSTHKSLSNHKQNIPSSSSSSISNKLTTDLKTPSGTRQRRALGDISNRKQTIDTKDASTKIGTTTKKAAPLIPKQSGTGLNIVSNNHTTSIISSSSNKSSSSQQSVKQLKSSKLSKKNVSFDDYSGIKNKGNSVSQKPISLNLNSVANKQITTEYDFIDDIELPAGRTWEDENELLDDADMYTLDSDMKTLLDDIQFFNSRNQDKEHLRKEYKKHEQKMEQLHIDRMKQINSFYDLEEKEMFSETRTKAIYEMENNVIGDLHRLESFSDDVDEYNSHDDKLCDFDDILSLGSL